MLELINVSKDYFDFEFVLKNVSFSLKEGYIMGLIGPNGSGKTTIINLIMNVIKPTGGEIKIFGLDNTLENNVAIKDKIGFVFDKSIYPEKLNLDKLGYIYKNLYSNFDEEYFEELIKKLKISKLKKLGEQSKGNQMKCQIALALSHNAKLILMDEPAAGLDPIVRRELIKILLEYRERTNAAILFSTHLTEDLEKVADYITYINNGKLIFSKSIEEMRDEYKILKCTISQSKMLNESDFFGYEKNEYYFKGLFGDSNIVIPEGAIVENATIQDIMYYLNRK
ncbi:ABC transporter ATP-binding protein [Anaerosphaera multitolerans]|uniref:ABC transporter ATP-binding protein n=1 Tax=Anaerosphaera multitolerans TaxID=2487351 RepID=A0A437S6A5_9FIRM|nr:ABC transporter ATP-binding protein [Anaerosphaera multitolerans]RVU54544.1 ABC transporter ATP-binding protein [Anaerosphaera multitolerans]